MNNDNNNTTINNKVNQYRHLIPRDQIIDCIVNEVILYHRGVNILVLRITIQNNIDNNTNNNTIQLLELFPGICIHIRNKIMKEIFE